MAVKCRKGRPTPLFGNARNSVAAKLTQNQIHFFEELPFAKNLLSLICRRIDLCSFALPRPCPADLCFWLAPSRRKKECLAHPWYIQWQTKSCPKQSQENPHSWNYKNFPTLAFNPDVAWRDHITHFFDLQNVNCGRKGQYFPQLGWPRLVT